MHWHIQTFRYGGWRGGGGGGHPDPEIKGDPASKFFFRLFGSHFGLKIPGSPTGMDFFSYR